MKHLTPREEAEETIKTARTAVFREAAALKRLLEHIDGNFVALVQLCRTADTVVVTGVGKSGIVGRKIAATLSASGTPAYYIHPIEAVHGDLGVVRPGDLVLAVSNSGGSSEVTTMLTHLKNRGVAAACITSNPKSAAAAACDLVVDTGTIVEVDPYGLCPTSSTTVVMALGDALAVALMRVNGFTKENYLENHPAGDIGEKLQEEG